MKTVQLLIDGGHLMATARKAGIKYSPDFIERVAQQAVEPNTEDLIRVLYYDCAPYRGTARLPISGLQTEFKGDGGWLDDLARRDLFAVRKGVLKFRGWTRKDGASSQPLSDADFKPNFVQKGVDLRIGLDLSNLANHRSVDRVLMIAADTDLIPAMKYGRVCGLQIVSVVHPGVRLSGEFLAHVDLRRERPWPTAVESAPALAAS